MLVDTYNQKGEKKEQTRLPKEIFDVKMNADLVHQVVVSQMANRRQVSAHTKDRSEVRGGGIKPWRQKGTGRARHGSIRSPLWIGGGVTFGPRKEKVLKKQIPSKIKIKALFMVLSEKVRKNLLVILDALEIDKPKTKEMAKILKNLPCKKNCLIILPNYDKKLVLSARNIPRIAAIEARNLNALELLSHQYLLMPKDSVKTIKETFTEKS
jgi:large subunit ribosomal protein L4